MKTKITFLIAALAITMNLFAGAVTVPVGSTATVTDLQTAMSDAVTAGNTDITLDFPSGYVLGTSSADVTIVVPAGVTKLTFFAASSVATKPVLYLNTLTFTDGLMTNGLVFNGVKLITGVANRYLIQPNANATKMPGKVIITNCWIEGFRAVVYTSSSYAIALSEVTFSNNYFKNIATGGIISVAAGTIANINIKKNTFNNVGGDASGATGSDYFIDFRTANSVSSQINFSNNTIYYPRTQGRGLFRLGNATFTTGYIKENNNIYSTGNATSFSLQLLYTNSTGAISDTDSTNYYSNKMTLGSNKGSILTTVYTENSPSNLFMNPAGDDFTITDANFAGKSVAGDPRWFPQALTNAKNITTSVSPANAGSITPNTLSVNSGTSVTLTATANFGYVFKEWRGAISNTVVASTAQYTFTATTDSSLVAVFDPVTTYNFSVSNSGSGASWGKVTLTPAPTNGKYEAGTSVTATVTPNAVTNFVKWEDNSTSLTRNITVNSDVALTATFDVIPFITGWDFKTASPNTARTGDYYSDTNNKGLLNIYDQNGTATSWLANTGSFSPSTPCSYLWTTGATFATNRRYWQATFSTLGYNNIQVNSQMAGSYQHYLTQKMQVSLNGTDFTDVASLDISTTAWANLNATLSAAYNNQTTVYVRWIANTASTLVGNSADNDGTAITNIFVYATPIGTQLSNNQTLNAFAASTHNGQIIINSSLKNGKATIYTLTGQKMEELSLTNASMLSNKLNSGIYMVKFEEAGVVSTQKVIVK